VEGGPVATMFFHLFSQCFCHFRSFVRLQTHLFLALFLIYSLFPKFLYPFLPLSLVYLFSPSLSLSLSLSFSPSVSMCSQGREPSFESHQGFIRSLSLFFNSLLIGSCSFCKTMLCFGCIILQFPLSLSSLPFSLSLCASLLSPFASLFLSLAPLSLRCLLEPAENV